MLSLQEWVNAKDTAEDEDNGQGVDPLAKTLNIAAINGMRRGREGRRRGNNDDIAARNEEAEKKPSLNSEEALSKVIIPSGKRG